MISINDKVIPEGYTKDHLGIGTVQEIIPNYTKTGETVAFVYWPRIGSEGAWPVRQLVKVAP